MADQHSWAYQAANSPEHMRMMIASVEKELAQKKESLARRTGTQSAREGPAKPSLVSSTLTPCSKAIALLKELDERYLTLLDWDFSYKESEEFHDRVTAFLGELA